ncbi:MAG: sugar kinase [Hyphomicrobiaceae bacterium]|nr:sugar kinase [Hyphomicrobiaceae bacterium]
MTPTAAGRVIAIGECMVELARGDDGRFGLAYGGDTFNTSVYLARAGVAVAYATALGDDPYSAGILALATSEGIATDLIQIRAGRMPGLYLIETSASGERSFHYWRDRSPARELLDGAGGDAICASLTRARLVYLSGITLSLYAPAALDRLATALVDARSAGARVAMDGNFRPRGWGGDRDRARAVMGRFWRLADIALPTFDDEQALWGDDEPAGTVARLQSHGAEEIVVKLGPAGALVAEHFAQPSLVPVPAPVIPVDTTAAGDSFNAAYLAHRLAGTPQVASAHAGHRLAGMVIAHRGAIAPREETAAAFLA